MNQPSQYVSETRTIETESHPVNVSSPIHTQGRAILLALVSALLIFAVSVSADLFLIRDHQPARLTIEISDGISAIVIGVLSYKIFRLQQQRREYVRHKVEVISDMNHHVRNALQVISLTTHGGKQDEIVAVRESVNRIQWALRE